MKNTDVTHSRKFMPFKEFVALMVLLMSLTALCIDAILPMLGVIGEEFQVSDANHVQYVISTMFFGLTAGQFVYGPLSDSYGRKTMIYIGMGLFCLGSLLSLLAGNFSLLLLGRGLQGLGAASSRVVTVAMVRDRYRGRNMARVMSIIMGTFIIVPALAPNIGQLILMFGHWRSIFIAFLVIAMTGVVWMHFRLPETLAVKNRRLFRPRVLWQGVREVATNKTTLGYTVCAGVVFGGFMGYLMSAQQLFQEFYNTGRLFSLYFSSLALAVGGASFLNSRIVRKYGMHKISRVAFISRIISSLVFLGIIVVYPHVPLFVFMVYALITFFLMGLLFGNLNTIAMEPMGHIAGIASAVIGAISSAISLTVGSLIGLSFNMTLFPITIGFLATSCIGLLIQFWTDHAKSVEG
jgi:DHA1 family bicyclomycin/chloramphenicol resistance-like MFS transporter